MSVNFALFAGSNKFEGAVDENASESDREIKVVELRCNSKSPNIAEDSDIVDIYPFEDGRWFGFAKERVLNENLGKLARLVGYHWLMPGAANPGAFRELFRWGGEGTIGPAVSAKLAADFVEWDERAQALGHASFYKFFVRLRAMFEYAMTSRCVRLRCA
ncbi:hypothetical protein [Paraburkholderia sp. BR14374]|uniref:hypothetical protein n=1 Tax=Paraburkholderia sp. BR14374 TaxID=3237007 RepID=UPI0034CE7D04